MISAEKLIARADKYLNTGSGEYAADIMRDMAEFIRQLSHAPAQAALVTGADTPPQASQIVAWRWRRKGNTDWWTGETVPTAISGNGNWEIEPLGIVHAQCACGRPLECPECMSLRAEPQGASQLRSALEQIAIVCTDNMGRSCDHRMALDFVRQVANDALSRPQRPEGDL